jgi:hypothetical protein
LRSARGASGSLEIVLDESLLFKFVDGFALFELFGLTWLSWLVGCAVMFWFVGVVLSVVDVAGPFGWFWSPLDELGAAVLPDVVLCDEVDWAEDSETTAANAAADTRVKVVDSFVMM